MTKDSVCAEQVGWDSREERARGLAQNSGEEARLEPGRRKHSDVPRGAMPYVTVYQNVGG